MNGFSVIMPTYNQSGYIIRAINSLLVQTFTEWELIIINDGSTDNTDLYIQGLIEERKNIKYITNKKNEGLGYSINRGLEIAKYNFISYLPSDDFYYINHLEELYKALIMSENNILAFCGMRYDTNDSLKSTNDIETFTVRKNYSLQLVQVGHRRIGENWIERSEFVSENLYYTFWHKLAPLGSFIAVKEITCYWTSHPFQRHKIMSEKYGGNLNYYRSFYKVKDPLKIKVSNYKFVNEELTYRKFRNSNKRNSGPGLKILIVGELGYNPERLCAFEEEGHTLFGLWIERPTFSHINVGPLPFGNVRLVDIKHYKEQVKNIAPDIIYALLNFSAVDLGHEVMTSFPDIPFVWHFKESPQVCISNGRWEKLIQLYTQSDGRIFINQECKLWFEQFIPKQMQSIPTMILDGDLPKIDHFTNNYSEKISRYQEGVHTVVPGRMIGMHLSDMKILAKNNIHFHIYTESYHEQLQGIRNQIKKTIPDNFHTHPHCSSDNWVSELSKYDAGWLHCFKSNNKKNIQRANWDDLNIPARLPTLAAAGLPVIQRNNSNHIVAMQSVVQQLNFGIFFYNSMDLINKLKNKNHLENLSSNIRMNRKLFSFDYHIEELIIFFKKVIILKRERN